jgi:hypothetical protein
MSLSNVSPLKTDIQRTSGNCIITLANTDPVIAWAGSELAKYLNKSASPAKRPIIIELGLFDDFSLLPPKGLQDPLLDDAIAVKVKSGKGYIAGTNGRSVLLGVYRFLGELGFSWIRPGKEGEIVPFGLPVPVNVNLQETAASRHRNICIEGAVSLSNVRDFIDWMPKAGYNSFFMQFREGYYFFDRWYSYENNSREKRMERFDRDTAREYTRIIEQEVDKRGLMYHAVGHGWHLEAFGVPGIGWKDIGPLPEEFLQKVALVNGKRWVPWNIPMLAALCYSDLEVQEKMVQCIADYADTNKRVNYLHVWLDDYMNNKCECDRCTTKRPADWYMQILNALDTELTQRNNPVKIVFLAYCDLLFPPLVERLRNESRFVFMFANNRQDFSKSLPDSTRASIMEYKQNQIDAEVLKQPEVHLAFLKSWRALFHGDAFVYEYYLTQPDFLALAPVIAEDVIEYRKLDMHGVSSCQTLRSFYPGLSVSLMGHALWSPQPDMEKFSAEYLKKALGDDSVACRDFLFKAETAVQEILKTRESDIQKALDTANGLRVLAKDFRPVIIRHKENSSPTISLTWQLVEFQTDLCILFAGYIDALHKKNITRQHFFAHAASMLATDAEERFQPWLEPMDHFRRLFPF